MYATFLRFKNAGFLRWCKLFFYYYKKESTANSEVLICGRGRVRTWTIKCRWINKNEQSGENTTIGGIHSHPWSTRAGRVHESSKDDTFHFEKCVYYLLGCIILDHFGSVWTSQVVLEMYYLYLNGKLFSYNVTGVNPPYSRLTQVRLGIVM